MLNEVIKELFVVLLIALVPTFFFLHFQTEETFVSFIKSLLPNIYFLGYAFLVFLLAIIPKFIKYFVYSSLGSFNVAIVFLCDVFDRASETLVGLLRGTVGVFIFILIVQLKSNQEPIELTSTFLIASVIAGFINIITIRGITICLNTKLNRKIN